MLGDMGLVERLSELESMRQSGQISDSEYAMLVASATKKLSEGAESTKIDAKKVGSENALTNIHSKSLANNSKLIGVGVVAVLIISFLIFGNSFSKDDPSVAGVDVSKTVTTQNVSDSVKYRKGRLRNYKDIFLKKRRIAATIESRIRAGDYQSRDDLIKLSGGLGLSYEEILESVTATYEEYPELAGEGGKVQKVLRELRNIYIAAYNKQSIPQIFSELRRVEPLWPNVVEASYQWEKAIQKIIDESP